MIETESKVDAFCIGVQKAGTTYLHHIFTNSGLSTSTVKETKFFCKDRSAAELEEYEKGFAKTRLNFRVEVDPEYMLSDGVLGRIKNYNPDAKVLIILRCPVERAVSHYMMSVTRGFENMPLNQALKAEQQRILYDEWSKVHFSYALRGRYNEKVQEAFDTFGKSNVLVLDFEALKADPRKVFEIIMDFLSIDGAEYVGSSNKHRASAARSTLFASLINRETWLKKVMRKVPFGFSILQAVVRYLRQLNLKKDTYPILPGTPSDFAEGLEMLTENYRRDLQIFEGVVIDRWFTKKVGDYNVKYRNSDL